MTQTPIPLPNLPTKVEKFLLFNLGSLNLAIAIDQVIRVLNHSVIHGSGLTGTGLIHLEDRSVTVIDLHRRLFHRPHAIIKDSKPYLILARNPSGEEFSIIIQNAPTLVDIPASQIRVLPDSYRQNDTLSCASHVIVFQEKGQSFTAFLLDGDRLVSSQP